MSKRSGFLVILIIITLILLGNVYADGGIVPNIHTRIYSPSQKAAIFWNGSTERMIISTRVNSENLTNLVWLVPIQSSTIPIVKKTNDTILSQLDRLLGMRIIEDRSPYPTLSLTGVNSARPKVEVIQSQNVDYYNITILKATDAKSLVDWLNSNGFNLSEDKINILDHYTKQDNYYFVANRINLFDNFTSNEKLKNCADRMYSDHDETRFSKYAECGGVDFNMLDRLLSLKYGISTPLEFTFTPEKPVYPMKISSMNEGYTTAHVYVFGKECFNDSSQILNFENAIQLSVQKSALPLQDYAYQGYNCVSKLSYEGQSSNLNNDSFFVGIPFKEEYQPNYEPPQSNLTTVSEVILGIIIILIGFLFLFASWAIIPGFIAGLLVFYYSNKKKKSSVRITKIVFGIITLLTMLILFLAFIGSILEIYKVVIVILLYLIFPIIGYIVGYKTMKNKRWLFATLWILGLTILGILISSVISVLY